MILKIKSITWDKQNYELFDTESNQYKVQLFQFRKEGFLYRDNYNNETYICEKIADIKPFLSNPQFKLIMIVAKMGQQFCVGSPKMMKMPPEDDLWTQAKKDQILKELDIIKLGKKQFKIVQITQSETQTTSLERPHYESFASIIESNFDSMISTNSCTDNKRQCRICLSTSYQQTNPMISVCKCAGSMKYIHYDCLKRWLDGKLMIKKQLPYCIEINSKSVRCELCLQFYPPHITLSGNRNLQLYDLGEFKMNNHVILEDLDGSIMVINFPSVEPLTLGRGHESHIKISEITVSRSHVTLGLKDKHLIINDLQSKFGTLIKQQNIRQINNENQIDLQSGRTKLELKGHIQEQSFLDLCGCKC